MVFVLALLNDVTTPQMYSSTDTVAGPHLTAVQAHVPECSVRLGTHPFMAIKLGPEAVSVQLLRPNIHE